MRQEGWTASLCQISSNSLEPQPRYGIFLIFKMTDADILDLLNFTF